MLLFFVAGRRFVTQFRELLHVGECGAAVGNSGHLGITAFGS